MVSTTEDKSCLLYWCTNQGIQVNLVGPFIKYKELDKTFLSQCGTIQIDKVPLPPPLPPPTNGGPYSFILRCPASRAKKFQPGLLVFPYWQCKKTIRNNCWVQLDFVTCVPIIYCVWGGSYGDGLTTKKKFTRAKILLLKCYLLLFFRYLSINQPRIQLGGFEWRKLFHVLYSQGSPPPPMTPPPPNQAKPIGQQPNVPWVNHPQLI